MFLEIGEIGIVHPVVSKKIDKKAAIVYAEIDVFDFAEIKNASITYCEPSRFPEMEIDISFVSDKFAPIGDAIKAENCSLIKSVSVVDTYTDENGTVQTEPSIDLGEHDTGFKLKITNTRILFTDGSTELVTINSKNKSLEIGKATIKSDLQFGDEEDNQIPGVWIWKQRANGNLGLVWKGAND